MAAAAAMPGTRNRTAWQTVMDPAAAVAAESFLFLDRRPESASRAERAGITLNPGVAYGATAGDGGHERDHRDIGASYGTCSRQRSAPSDMTLSKSHVGNFHSWIDRQLYDSGFECQPVRRHQRSRHHERHVAGRRHSDQRHWYGMVLLGSGQTVSCVRSDSLSASAEVIRRSR